DNRSGPTSATVPKLLDWSLKIYLAATNASTLMISPSTPVTLTVYTTDTYYFMVDVPFEASFATNSLTSISGGQLDLVFNQTFLPDGTHAGDFTLLNNITAGSSTLNKTTSSPLLQSGIRYYLGVKNQNTAETNTFTLRVDFNTTNLTVLNEFHTVFGSLPPTAQPEKFYQVQVPAGVTAVLFELSGLTGSADMFVAKGRLPSATDYEYLGTAPISTARRVYVKQSVDFPDISGTWYIGVRNNEAASINYYFNISFPIDGDVIPTIIPLTMGTTPSVTAGGDVNVGFVGLSGETYLVEYTTDFVTWTPLKYVTAVSDSVQFTDTPTGAELRFYRVSQVPAP
ncbi:MAG TPA: hypothetical protein VK968_06535, partial [Roseimicrobium sp.]|nr:hypothetical protein [Roseimicrobium sp.]